MEQHYQRTIDKCKCQRHDSATVDTLVIILNVTNIIIVSHAVAGFATDLVLWEQNRDTTSSKIGGTEHVPAAC